jgi:hypothetical protein
VLCAEDEALNWEAIGAFAELLSSIGVLITLVYLATQMRYARKELTRSVRQNRSDTLRDLYLSRLNNPPLMKIYSQFWGAAAIDHLTEKLDLSEEEGHLVLQDQLAWWQYTDQVVLDCDDLTEGEKYQFHRGLVSRYKNNLVGAAWYQISKDFLNPATVRYVDKVLLDAGA